MKNHFINWVKSYDIKHNGLTDSFFIASHKQGFFNGLLVYVKENLNRNDTTIQPRFTVQTEYLPDLSEEKVYNKVIERLKELFGDNIEITEDKTNRRIKW